MGRWILRLSLALPLATAAITVPAAAAGGQSAYPPAISCLTLTPTAGEVGTSVAVAGANRTPGSTVAISFDDTVIGTATAGESGAFATTVTIPERTGFGRSTISASGGASGCQGSATFQVLSTASSSAAGAEDHGVFGQLETAAGVVVLAVALVIATRRRRVHDRSQQSHDGGQLS